MSEAPKPWGRKAPKLWLPDAEPAARTGAQQAALQGVTAVQHNAFAPLQLTAGNTDDGSLTGDEDELDRLTFMYASEAAASSQRMQQRQQQWAQSHKGMAALRQEGLSKPLEPDNRCMPRIRFAMFSAM